MTFKWSNWCCVGNLYACIIRLHPQQKQQVLYVNQHLSPKSFEISS